MGTDAYFWTTDVDVNDYVWRVNLGNASSIFNLGAGGFVTAIQKKDGNSVRCVKDYTNLHIKIPINTLCIYGIQN
jgi:hypothetical protein